jgi:hypothetical protein
MQRAMFAVMMMMVGALFAPRGDACSRLEPA